MNEAEIVKAMRLQDFSFYSARHSWATIARNDLNIDKWTIHEGLNHVDNATKITDVYIKRDFTRINEANFKVIEYVLAGVWENLPK
jgi:integrase